jgi:hypothetical protein
MKRSLEPYQHVIFNYTALNREGAQLFVEGEVGVVHVACEFCMQPSAIGDFSIRGYFDESVVGERVAESCFAFIYEESVRHPEFFAVA